MFKLPKLSTTQVDKVNIGLMIISLALAFVLPFEVFLFSYAVLGPLHYLTEISWLHKKNYFVPAKKNYNKWLFAIFAGFLTIFIVIAEVFDLFKIKTKEPLDYWSTNIIFFLFALACVLVLIPKLWQKVIGIVIVGIISLSINMGQSCTTCTNPQTKASQSFCEDNQKKERNFIQKNGFDTDGDGYIDTCKSSLKYHAAAIFFTAYLPTLIHVYLFTMLFMLFGALKSSSKFGLVGVGVLILCGILPFVWDPAFLHYSVSSMAKKSYDASFFSLNKIVFDDFTSLTSSSENIYGSSFGIMLTRFIAFAYTYHYLNWFSKTSIIQWHKMPVVNLSVVLVLWVTSVILYYVDYKLGLTMLLLLSFLHVFLEFPLNFQSLVGILKSLFGKKKAATIEVKSRPKS